MSLPGAALPPSAHPTLSLYSKSMKRYKSPLSPLPRPSRAPHPAPHQRESGGAAAPDVLLELNGTNDARLFFARGQSFVCRRAHRDSARAEPPAPPRTHLVGMDIVSRKRSACLRSSRLRHRDHPSSFCMMSSTCAAAPGAARRRGAPPLPRTNRTSLVPPLVLIGHVASPSRHRGAAAGMRSSHGGGEASTRGRHASAALESRNAKLPRPGGAGQGLHRRRCAAGRAGRAGHGVRDTACPISTG